MATINPTMFLCFAEDMPNGVHNLGSDTLKMALSNTEPTAATDTVWTDITEISAGDGYTSKGETVTIASSSQTAGIYALVGSGTVVWTSTGTIGPFQYPVLLNEDSASDSLICYYDIGSPITLNNGDSYTIDMAQTIFDDDWT
jgi:hypothetical protein